MPDFRVLRILGNGGFGRAMLVVTESGDQKVLKEIYVDCTEPAEAAMIKREIDILRLLKHSNIIRYENSFVKDQKVFILMEYANSGDMSEMIKKRKGVHWSEETVIDYFVQMCLALKYIHDRKIVHRDIKPSNFFVNDQGIVKLGDFGLATFLPFTNALLDTSLGTPQYLAPEICLGRKYNQKSDIWALGCVLYEMCALRRLFNGRTLRQVMTAIHQKAIPALPTCYSPELQSLVSLLLRRKPCERPSVNEILSLPFVRFKAIALLGKTQARLELSHSVFHGFEPGICPDEAIQEVHLVNEKQRLLDALEEAIKIETKTIVTTEEEEDEKIEFMGRTLVFSHAQNSTFTKTKAEEIREFIQEIVGPEKFDELYQRATVNPLEEPASKTDMWVHQLVVRLIACEESPQ